ncbi:hypothetical protein [Massilia sp.]|uniref:hypothetical protein n=1 Tax=Massilia sp. TaxID=1882437 RepID=UPI00352F1882
MSGFTILKAKILLKCPVDSAIDRGLRLLTSDDPTTFDNEISDLPDHPFWQSSAYFMLQGRLAYDGRSVVVDAKIKNKNDELDNLLLWLTPSIEQLEDGSWYNEDGLDDEPLELSFACETGKFLLRGPDYERELATELWRPTATP